MATDTWAAGGFSKAGMTPTAGQTFAQSLATGVSAAGTTQGTATDLTAQVSVVTTVGASSGVRFDPALMVVGALLCVRNDTGTNAMLLYPPSGAAIDGNGANTGVSVATNSGHVYVVASATQLYTIV